MGKDDEIEEEGDAADKREEGGEEGAGVGGAEGGEKDKGEAGGEKSKGTGKEGGDKKEGESPKGEDPQRGKAASPSREDKAAEKERKAQEAKEAKERKEQEKLEAKGKKAQDYEQRKQAAELKKREKELAREKARKAAKHNPSAWQRISKEKASKVVFGVSGVLLATALGSIGICSYWLDSALKADALMRAGMVQYCLTQGLASGCLAIPQIVMLPFYGFLAWACALSLLAMVGIHGAAKDATASLDLFNIGGGFLGCVAIALSTIALLMSSELTAQCGLLPSYCLQDATATNATSTPTPEDLSQEQRDLLALCNCAPPGGLVGRVRERYETLWSAGQPLWQRSFGCGWAMSAKEGSDCLAFHFGQATLIMSCLMLIPILLEAIGAVFALRLRAWIVQERGRDLFPTCRLASSTKACMIPAFLFICIFGIVVVAIAPR